MDMRSVGRVRGKGDEAEGLNRLQMTLMLTESGWPSQKTEGAICRKAQTTYLDEG